MSLINGPKDKSERDICLLNDVCILSYLRTVHIRDQHVISRNVRYCYTQDTEKILRVKKKGGIAFLVSDISLQREAS